MYLITKSERNKVEKEYLATLLLHTNLVPINQIKPQYLKNDQHKEILNGILDSYNKKRQLDIGYIVDRHPKIDVDYLAELINDTYYYDGTPSGQFQDAEEGIITFYKEDIIEKLNNELKNHKISYEDYMAKIKKLDDIHIVNEIQPLTKEEIYSGIEQQNTRINLRKFPKLNYFLKLVQNDFVIIGALTGTGKSGFLLNLMDDLMDNYQCIYFNMEMSKSTVYKRLVSIRADIPIKNFEEPKKGETKLIEEKINEIVNNKVIIEHKINTIKNIRRLLTKVKDKDKHTILFIDHLGLTKAEDKKSLYEQATEVAKELRQICLEYNCTIISASQLNRTASNSEKITLTMLKDSGELENSASKVLLLYPEEGQNLDELKVKMSVDIAKNRDGLLKKVTVIYDKERQIFREEML